MELECNVISLNSCLKACRHWSEGLGLLKRLRLEPDVISFNSILKLGARPADVLAEMELRRPSELYDCT